MYILYQTMKTPNDLFSLAILLYSILLAIICPKLRRIDKYFIVVSLCILPVLAVAIHFVKYGKITFWAHKFLYLEAVVPLILIFPGKKKASLFIKSIVSIITTLVVCVSFILLSTSSPMVHNYTGYSYTDSFKKMMEVLEKEYCLSSWKKIDYDSLLREYLPKVEEAEKNNDEVAYSAIITEVTYRFYDSHVYNFMHSGYFDCLTCEYLAGNDYGLSLIKTDDGRVIAVHVEDLNDYLYADSSILSEIGIHNGTEITSWDGRDINDAINDTECIYPSLQFPVKSNEDIYRPLFLAGKGDETVEITFIDDNGKEQSARLKKLGTYDDRLIYTIGNLEHLSTDYPNNFYKMLDDKCGYLYICSENFGMFSDDIAVARKGYYPKLVEYYAGIIENLKAQGMEYLVVDIRNNHGGYDNVAGAFTSLFTEEKIDMFSMGYEDESGYHITENHYIFPDGRYKDLPVAVLVNNSCVSAGDGMAKFLGECPNVILMGISASGGVNQSKGGYIYLTDNICVEYPVFLSLSSDGEPLIDTDSTRENRIPLDVEIPITEKAALEIFSLDDADYELDYAVKYLEEHELNGTN